jgi:hypothetical protein
MLALPSAEGPAATLYRQVDGTWILESDEQSSPLKTMQVFEVYGRSYRFSASSDSGLTFLATNSLELSVGQSDFSFQVSQDEEYVHLEVLCAGRTIDIGSRGHNYLLLTLARRRLADTQAGHEDAAAGWVTYEDLANDPTMAPAQLHIHIFRIRRQFAGLGFTDAPQVIERRPRVGQLRIGAPRIRIRRT